MGWIGRIFDYIFASDIPCCPYCGKEGGLCGDCADKTDMLRNPGLTAEVGAEYAGVFSYAEPVRGLVHDLKFNAHKYQAKYMGKEIADLISKLGWEADAITFVPQYGGYHRDRGFNQAKALAEKAAEELELPLLDTLKCVEKKKRQSRAGSAAERREAVKGKYAAMEKVAVGKRLILIDDVITTGSTAAECVAVLYGAGAQDVKVAVFAIAGQDSEL